MIFAISSYGESPNLRRTPVRQDVKIFVTSGANAPTSGENPSDKTLKSLLPQGASAPNLRRKPVRQDVKIFVTSGSSGSQTQEKTPSDKTLKSLLPQGAQAPKLRRKPRQGKDVKTKAITTGRGPFKEPCQKRR